MLPNPIVGRGALTPLHMIWYTPLHTQIPSYRGEYNMSEFENITHVETEYDLSLIHISEPTRPY